MGRLLASLSSALVSMILLAALPLDLARAADWYVDADHGSNSGAGDIASPWRTIRFALQQPLTHGDTLRVRGSRAAFSMQETYPIRLPAGIALRTWDSSSTAVLDAGSLPCLLIDGDGHYNQTIDGETRSLTLSGNPAIQIRPSGPSALLDLTVRGLNIEGDLILDHDNTVSLFGGHILRVSDCHIAGQCNLYPAYQSPFQYLHILRAYVSDSRISGGLSAVGINDTLEITRCDIDNGVLARENYSWQSQHGRMGGRTFIRSCRIRSGNIATYGSNLLQPEISDCVVEAGSILAFSAWDCNSTVVRSRAQEDIEVDAHFDATCTDSVAGDLVRVSGQDIYVDRNRCARVRASGGTRSCRIIGNYVVGEGISATVGNGLGTYVVDNYVEVTALPTTGAAIDLGTAYDAQRNIVLDRIGCPVGIRAGAGLLGNTIEGFDVGAEALDIGFGYRSCTQNTFVSCRIDALRSSIGYVPAEIVGNLFYDCGNTAINLRRVTGSIEPLALVDNVFVGNSVDISAGVLQSGDTVTNNHSTAQSFNSYHASNQGGETHLDTSSMQLLPTSPCIGASSQGGTMGPLRLGQLAPELRITNLGQQATLRWEPSTQRYNGLGIVLIGAYPANVTIPYANGLLGLDPQSYLAALPVQLMEYQPVTLSFPLPGGPLESVMQGLRTDASTPGGLRLTNTAIFRIL